MLLQLEVQNDLDKVSIEQLATRLLLLLKLDFIFSSELIRSQRHDHCGVVRSLVFFHRERARHHHQNA